MDPSITTRFPLDGWEVTTVEETATGWQVTVEAPRPVQCPHCGHPRLHRHDTFPARVVPHLWVGLRPLTVTWVPPTGGGVPLVGAPSAPDPRTYAPGTGGRPRPRRPS